MKRVLMILSILSLLTPYVKAETITPDIQIESIYVDDVEVEKMPDKSEGYYFKNATCSNGVKASFDEENFELILNNITGASSCRVYFTSKMEEKKSTDLSNKDTIENPSTGSFINIATIIVSLGIAIVSMIFVIRKKKFFRI